MLNRLTLILAGTASFKKECFFIPSLPTSVMSKNQVQHVTMYDRINIYRKRHRALHIFLQYFHMNSLKRYNLLLSNTYLRRAYLNSLRTLILDEWVTRKGGNSRYRISLNNVRGH